MPKNRAWFIISKQQTVRKREVSSKPTPCEWNWKIAYFKWFQNTNNNSPHKTRNWTKLDVVFSILEIETARTAPTHKRTYEHKPKNKTTWPADKRNWIENFQFWCNDLRQMTSIDWGTWTRTTRLLRSITSSFITFHHFFCRYLAILSVPRIFKRYSVATSEAK